MQHAVQALILHTGLPLHRHHAIPEFGIPSICCGPHCPTLNPLVLQSHCYARTYLAHHELESVILIIIIIIIIILLILFSAILPDNIMVPAIAVLPGQGDVLVIQHKTTSKRLTINLEFLLLHGLGGSL